MPKPIPPKNTVRVDHVVTRVHHGVDVTIRLRSLNLTHDLTDTEAAIVAWGALGQQLEEEGLDLVDAINTMPKGRND